MGLGCRSAKRNCLLGKWIWLGRNMLAVLVEWTLFFFIVKKIKNQNFDLQMQCELNRKIAKKIYSQKSKKVYFYKNLLKIVDAFIVFCFIFLK
jgi:hypothetical protein